MEIGKCKFSLRSCSSRGFSLLIIKMNYAVYSLLCYLDSLSSLREIWEALWYLISSSLFTRGWSHNGRVSKHCICNFFVMNGNFYAFQSKCEPKINLLFLEVSNEDQPSFLPPYRGDLNPGFRVWHQPFPDVIPLIFLIELYSLAIKSKWYHLLQLVLGQGVLPSLPQW